MHKNIATNDNWIVQLVSSKKNVSAKCRYDSSCASIFSDHRGQRQ